MSPVYMSQPAAFQTRPLLIPGRPFYAFGSSDSRSSDTLAYVTNTVLTGNVVTISLTLAAGKIPVVGQSISIQGTTNGAGLFNVTGATITVVGGFNTGDNSIGTVQFALTHANVTTAADAGQAVLPVPETTDALANGASQQVAAPFNDPRIDQARTITAQVAMPSLPTTATVALQASDDDSTYYDMVTVATVSGGVLSGGFVQVQNSSARFYRLNVSNVAGGSTPTIIGKISA